jgi:hypothetical protein
VLNSNQELVATFGELEGIAQPDDPETKVYVSNGTLVIEAPVNEPISVYNLYGQQVYYRGSKNILATANSTVRISSLNAGFYAVKVGKSRVRKVIVM